MSTITIREASVADSPAIATMLLRLANDIGDADVFLSNMDTIREYGFGAKPFFHCMIAEKRNQPCGLVLYYPHFSTIRGLPGIFVLDLWVDSGTRGAGTGRRLLAAAARHARNDWGARHLALAVYRTNDEALRFYRKLGFAERSDDIAMVLGGTAFGKLLDLSENAK